MDAPTERRPNHLVSEKSPYLLQHAHNPVDWFPWSDEALRKAKNDGKPILLSIGYSSCHWCHVMRRESFEDQETARTINKNFVAIKVDREERPDLDSYYMGAVQAMTGGGGWPLTVFLTPDLRPFYGGTYYPPEPRQGMPSFRQILDFVSRVWKERRGEALETSAEVTKTLASVEDNRKQGDLSRGYLEAGYAALAASFDQQHGGFGMAPKFPLPLSVSFMLRYNYRTGNKTALMTATKTLDAMAQGGIRDHVGGGFHRYATDRTWLVPHFEKMLYDNALMVRTLLEAYQVTRLAAYSECARETLGWMLAEMQDDGGAFYSSQDADTEEGEGTYYTWTPEEVEGVLGEGKAADFCRAYGVTRAGNFESGRSILHLTAGPSPEKDLEEARLKLYASRRKRPRPRTDEKILTSWNGLAVSALAFAGGALHDEKYVMEAEKAATFVMEKCSSGGRLLRRYAGGEAGIEATAEDYSYLVQGLLDLFEATSGPLWLQEAVRLNRQMTEIFLDPAKGGFFTSRGTSTPPMKDAYDGPTPSANSVAAMNQVRIAELTGEVETREIGERTMKAFAQDLESQPGSHSYMLAALDSYMNGMKEVVVCASDRAAGSKLRDILGDIYLPATASMVAVPENYEELSRLSPLLEGRKPGKQETAYVCENFACKTPATSAEELRSQLASGSH